eukprot:scaffold328_cov130-Cylindrotheca_fusiformis.AAC.4
MSTSSSSSSLVAAPAHEEEFVCDVLKTMCRLESSTYQRLQSSYFSSSSDTIPESWRSMLIGWMYQVVDFSHVQRETIGVAMYLFDVCIDRLLPPMLMGDSSSEKNATTSKKFFQLAAATSLQLAVKTHDCKVIKHKDLTMLGRGAFSEEEVAELETKLFQACNWRLHPPSVYCFINEYMKLIQVGSKKKANLHHIAMIITEVILPEFKYKAYPPSITAYATILLAMASMDHPNTNRSISYRSRRSFCDTISKKILSQDTSLIAILNDLQSSMQRSSQLDFLGKGCFMDSTTLDRILTDTRIHSSHDDNDGTSDSYDSNKNNSSNNKSCSRTSPESPVSVTENWRKR